MGDLLGYFITFRTYGTWLHGDERGSTDRRHNAYGTPWMQRDVGREAATRERMLGPAYVMGIREREVVRGTIEETCRHREWHVWALKVQTNHVHVVVVAPRYAADRVMNDLKAYATRGLRKAGLVDGEHKVWSRHGSTPHLYTTDQLAGAIEYVEMMQDARE